MEPINKITAELVRLEIAQALTSSECPLKIKKESVSYLKVPCQRIVGANVSSGPEIADLIMNNSRRKTREVLEKYCFTNNNQELSETLYSIVTKPWEKMETLDVGTKNELSKLV